MSMPGRTTSTRYGLQGRIRGCPAVLGRMGASVKRHLRRRRQSVVQPHPGRATVWPHSKFSCLLGGVRILRAAGGSGHDLSFALQRSRREARMDRWYESARQGDDGFGRYCPDGAGYGQLPISGYEQSSPETAARSTRARLATPVPAASETAMVKTVSGKQNRQDQDLARLGLVWRVHVELARIRPHTAPRAPLGRTHPFGSRCCPHPRERPTEQHVMNRTLVAPGPIPLPRGLGRRSQRKLQNFRREAAPGKVFVRANTI